MQHYTSGFCHCQWAANGLLRSSISSFYSVQILNNERFDRKLTERRCTNNLRDKEEPNGVVLPSLVNVLPVLAPAAAASLAIIMVLAVGYHVTRRENLNILLNLVLGALALFVT